MVEPHVPSAQAYDPLWNSGAAPSRKGKVSRLAIVLSIAAHAAVIYAVYETKFVLKAPPVIDQRMIIDVVPMPKRPPPPPEAPKPQPVAKTPAPRPLDLHQTIPVEGLALPEPIPFWPPPVPLPPEPSKPVAPEPPAPRVISNPNWSTQPSPDDMARYYPDRAARLERTGNVLLQCLVTAKGAVSTCSVISEDPTEFGFGDAALKLSRLFKLRPGSVDGQAIEGAQVKIPIAFRIG